MTRAAIGAIAGLAFVYLVVAFSQWDLAWTSHLWEWQPFERSGLIFFAMFPILIGACFGIMSGLGE